MRDASVGLIFLRWVTGNLCPFSVYFCLWSQASCVHNTVGHCLPSLFPIWCHTVRGGRQPASPCASLLSSLPPMWSENGYELVQTCLRAEGRHRQPGSLPVFMCKTFTLFIVWSQAACVPPTFLFAYSLSVLGSAGVIF